jgi:hypothetical protein
LKLVFNSPVSEILVKFEELGCDEGLSGNGSGIWGRGEV